MKEPIFIVHTNGTRTEASMKDAVSMLSHKNPSTYDIVPMDAFLTAVGIICYGNTWKHIVQSFKQDVSGYPNCKMTPDEFIALLLRDGLDRSNIRQALAIVIYSKKGDGRFYDSVRKYFESRLESSIKEAIDEDFSVIYPAFSDMDAIHSSHLNSTALAFMRKVGEA
jgi:hypothetical protein